MIPLVYVVRDEELRRPDRTAMAALEALRDEFAPVVFAAGERGREAVADFGLPVRLFDGAKSLMRQLREMLADSPDLTFVAGETREAYLVMLLNTLYRRRLNHIHVVAGDVDGGALNRSSALRKFNVQFVAESESVRAGLIARGVGRERIKVLDRFIGGHAGVSKGRRRSFQSNGVRRVAVVGRPCEVEAFVDRFRPVPASDFLEFVIFSPAADGGANAPTEINATFAKSSDPWRKPSDWDLLLCLTPWEKSDLHVLEAFAARVPVLIAADSDHTAVISDGINGFTFRDGDMEHLAERLMTVSRCSPDRLNAIAKGGEYLLKIRFSAEKGIERYRQLFEQRQLPPVEISGGKLIL